MPSVGRIRRETEPIAATFELSKATPMLPTMPANQTTSSRMVATIPPVMGARRVLKSRPIVIATTPSRVKKPITASGLRGTYPTTRFTTSISTSRAVTVKSATSPESPSQRPSTISLRRRGRGTMARITPDSMSDAIAGAATKTDAKASRKLNMKQARISMMASIWVMSEAVVLGPPSVGTLEKPQPIPAITISVSAPSAIRSRRREASTSVSRAIVRIAISGLLLLQQLQEAVLQRLLSRLDGVDPPAQADDRLDQLRHGGLFQAVHRQPVAFGRDRAEAA